MSDTKWSSLAEVAEEHGVENIRVFYLATERQSFMGMSFSCSSDPRYTVEGRFVESELYRVADNYKVRVQPLDETYGGEEYYSHDFESLSGKFPDEFYVMVGDVRIPLGFVEVQEAA